MAADPRLPAQAEATLVVPAFAGASAQPSAQVQPDSAFDSLFRRPDGEANPHSHTRLMAPVQADYRMAPPSPPAAPVNPQSDDGYQSGNPPDGQQDWYDSSAPSSRKPMILGAVAAVGAVTAVILGLLYVGGHSDSNTAGGAGTNSAVASANAPQSIPAVVLPPGAATSASPAPSATSRAGTASTANSALPLSQGSTGHLVLWVQTRLKQLNFYRGPLNSQFDAATALAVAEFQAAAHVTIDPSGTVNRSTVTALIAAGPKPDLKPGSKSPADVKRLQEALNTAENAALNVNGRYDAATTAAVWRYQTAVGINPTGFMNAPTWAELQSGTIV
jgi:peptidoglycan hydrolase-like protein with peptidoglycan-binding domain